MNVNQSCNDKNTNRKWTTGMRVMGKYVERVKQLCVSDVDRSKS